MCCLNILLPTLDRDADLDNPHATNQLRVVHVEVATRMVAVDEVTQVFRIGIKLLGTENRTLCYRTVYSIGLGLLRTWLK